MEDNKVTADEARRAFQHQSMKARVEKDVNTDIAGRAEYTTPAEAHEMDRVAGRLRGKAISEVVGTDREVRRSRLLARMSQVIDYVFYVVYVLLAVRLGLALIAARSSNGFVELIRTVTDPFYSMFRGIVASPTAGGYTLVVPILIAIGVYLLFHVGITRLLRLIAHRRTAI
jgi:uncharacterized protein YggT (Ycf19 family)